MTQQIVRIDGIKWHILPQKDLSRLPVPLCPEHNLRMTPKPSLSGRKQNSRGSWEPRIWREALHLECAEGPHVIEIPREYDDQKSYVINKIDAQIFKGMKVVDLDGELTPIAKEKLKSEDGNYFITSQLMQSKRGVQLVVYAGEKGSDKKTQIFVEPKIKRVAFDQKDLHPTDVFCELKAVFEDGSSHEIKKATK